MLRTSTRLLRLIALLQSRRHWSGAELAQRLEIDARSVRRDIERVRELGYPVHASSGPGGGYQLGSGAQLPPVLLDDDEAVAVAVALRAGAASIGGLEDTALRALTKLDALLPARLRRRAGTLHATTLTLQVAPPLVDVGVLTRVAAACRDRRCLRFDYSSHQGQRSRREVEPLRLANYGRRWYLVAWDRGRADWRTFRLDRVAASVRVGDSFIARTFPGDLSEYLTRAIAVSPFPVQLRVRVRGSVATLAEQVPLWCGVLEAVDEYTSLLTVGGESISIVLAHILVAGVDFELLDDEPLRQELEQALAHLQRGLRQPTTVPAT